MAFGVVLSFSCSEKEQVFADLNGDEKIVPVSISLALNLGEMQDGTPHTRAVDDIEDPASPGPKPRIRTLCILQYDGTSEAARLIGDVHYLEASGDADLDLSGLKLADSGGQEHTLVILANTFTRLPQIKTLGEMLDLTRFVGSEADVLGHKTQSEGFSTDTDYYQRLNGLAVAVIAEGASIQGVLHRSMARIDVEIVNNGQDGLQIQKVQLCNVSQQDYYITDYSYVGAGSPLRPGAFRDRYPVNEGMRMNYPVKTWTGTEGGTGTATYRWYTPSNMRGTDPNLTNLEKPEGQADWFWYPMRKNLSPNALGATYLYILARYGTDADSDGLNDESIEYRFYLGENLKDNFDISPNSAYTYRFTFNGIGRTESDKRINEFSRVDFDVDANCYIVNPAPAGEGVRKYTFNVVQRPNIFWGDRYGVNSTYRPDQPYVDYTLSEYEGWHAWVLWSDVAYDANAILTKNSGRGCVPADYMDNSESGPRVELTIPSDIPEGNLVIAVSSDTAPTTILWSWHIWITRYQPDDIAGVAPVEDTYVYNVVGGEVHRYNNAAFNTGAYRNGYAMDRNLGALDQKYHNFVGFRGGGLTYQFGRKDPFPGSHSIYTYDSAGNRTLISGENDVCPKINKNNTGTGNKNVPYSVTMPRYLIVTLTTDNGTWTHDTTFNPNNSDRTIPWFDPFKGDRVDHEEIDAAADNKSIFDPCPPGWRVPPLTCYQGFTSSSNGWSETDPSFYFVGSVERYIGTNRAVGGDGFTYFPFGFVEAKENGFEGKYAQTSFFHRNGGRYFHGNVNGNWNSNWTSTRVNQSRGYPRDGSTTNGQANSMAVRCVRK